MLLVLYNFIDRTIQTFLFDVKENYRQNVGKSMELLYLIDLSKKTVTKLVLCIRNNTNIT